MTPGQAAVLAAGTGGAGSPAGDVAATTSTGEAVLFWILATVAVIAALGVVASSRAVYSALFLALTMIIMAVFYIAQGALFLGVVQVVVYTGAVMMLFLFVLMLVGISSEESLVETLKGQRVASILVGIGFGALLVGGIGHAVAAMGPGGTGAPGPGGDGHVDALAELIFDRYLWAFELTGALLITATVGAMILAHREQLGPVRTQRELSRERIRTGRHVTPMPPPGVYARNNAVDSPARLPDGTYSTLSVSPALRAGHTIVGPRPGVEAGPAAPPAASAGESSGRARAVDGATRALDGRAGDERYGDESDGGRGPAS